VLGGEKEHRIIAAKVSWLSEFPEELEYLVAPLYAFNSCEKQGGFFPHFILSGLQTDPICKKLYMSKVCLLNELTFFICDLWLVDTGIRILIGVWWQMGVVLLGCQAWNSCGL